MKTERTESMTPGEIAFAQSLLSGVGAPAHLRVVPETQPVRAALIRAKVRTGLRLSTAVAQGFVYIEVVAYSLNRQGKPSGVGQTRKLAMYPAHDVDSVVAFLNALQAPQGVESL